MRNTLILTVVMLVLAACVTSDDPSEGGFFNGVTGVASGAYAARIETREQSVTEAQARNAELLRQQQTLAAQINGAESELAKLKFTILQQKNALGALDGATSARVNGLLNANPTGTTAERRLAALRKTISDARALSADLAQLAG